MDVVVRKLQENVLSEEAIESFCPLYRKRLAARRKIVPVDDGKLRKQIATLDRQIEQGAERVFSAPARSSAPSTPSWTSSGSRGTA